MKRFVFFVVCALMLAGCATQNVDKEKDNQSTTSKKVYDSNNQKEQAISTSTSNMFEIKNGVLVRYKGGYNKALKIVLPQKVKEIASKAFILTKDEKKHVGELKVSSIEIGKDVKLHKNAFYGAGPLKVTLLDGRINVEKHSFSEMGKYGCESEIFMCESIKTIEEYAFYEENGTKKVYLNNNLERIEKSGLYGAAYSDLPDSIKYLGSNSLGYASKQITKLPENLEYIGEHCLTLYGGKIKVSSHVKKMAVNAIVWECTNSDVQGYEVDKNNLYYKSESNGWLYSKDGKKLFYAYRLPSENNVVIPKGVEKVYKKGVYMYGDDFAPGEKSKIIN